MKARTKQKLKKWGTILIPAILIILMAGSSLSAFQFGAGGEGALTGEEAVLIINITNVQRYVQYIQLENNMSALEFLLTRVPSIRLNSEGQLQCITNLCNTNESKWEFSINLEPANQTLEQYFVQPRDIIMFKYNISDQTSQNQEPDIAMPEGLI